MLIHLHSSLCKKFQDDQKSFRELVLAAIHHVKQKHHVIVADSELGNLKMNGEEAKALKVFSAKRAQVLQIAKILKRYIIIDDSKEIRLEGNRVYVGFDYIVNNISLLDKTILIGENNNDSHFYSKNALAVLSDKKMDSEYSLSYFAYPGGGGTTHENYLEVSSSDEKRLTLAIVDSDKSCQFCPNGSTSAPFLSERDKGVNDCYILKDHREIENIIGKSAICLLHTKKENILLKSFSDDHLRFMDIKKTIKQNKIECTHNAWDNLESEGFSGKRAKAARYIKDFEVSDADISQMSDELKSISNLILAWCLSTKFRVI